MAEAMNTHGHGEERSPFDLLTALSGVDEGLDFQMDCRALSQSGTGSQ